MRRSARPRDTPRDRIDIAAVARHKPSIRHPSASGFQALANISPLAPDRFPALDPVPGVRLAAGASGERYVGRRDLLLVDLAPGTSVAGVTTRSKTAAPPVLWTREMVKAGRAAALVVNAGNANAFTGSAGALCVDATARAAAAGLNCPQREVAIASTGVIGERPKIDRITGSIPGLAAALTDREWEAAADAIRTTDTFAKGAGAKTRIGDTPVTIAGIAKGSGMIAPDMATMLAFVFTDAALPAPLLDRLLRQAVNRSFNAITVDGDTSTSDMALLFATGRAGNDAVQDWRDRRLSPFREALGAVCRDLAQQIVRDGEGATKFVTIRVAGATSEAAARRIGLVIANSPLVKTAIAGGDANWGRIVAAVGKTSERIDVGALAISMGGTQITDGESLVEGYDEAPVAAHLAGSEVEIGIDVGVGRGRATVWTCDLTHGYIDINADYRS